MNEQINQKEMKVDSNYVDPILVDSIEEVEKSINEARTAFEQVHKKTMNLNRIVAAIFILLIIGGSVVTFLYSKYVLYLLIAIIVCFVGVFIFTKLSRKKLNDAVRTYLDIYSNYTDSFIFNNEKITDVKLGFKEKVNPLIVEKMDFLSKVGAVGSRDMIKGKMSGKYFEAADVSIKDGEEKDIRKQKAVFVGKVFNFQYLNPDFGRTILYLKGCGDSAPNKLEEVNQVNVDGLSNRWVVYTSNNNYSRIFTNEIVKVLNNLVTDSMLNDVLITIQKEQIIIGLSYSDELMVIPFDKEFKVEPLSHYKKDLNFIIELNEAVIKNHYFKDN